MLRKVANYRYAHIKFSLLIKSVTAEFVEPIKNLVVFVGHLQTDGISFVVEASRVHRADDREHRVIVGNFVRRDKLNTFFDDFLCLLLVTLGNKPFGKARHHATNVHNAYLTAVVFLDYHIRLVHATPFKLMHEILIHTLGVDFASFVVFGLHDVWHNAIRKTFEPHILVETDVIARAAARRKIYRTLPIVGGKDVHNDEVALGEIVFGNIPMQLIKGTRHIALVQRSTFQAVLLVDRNGDFFGRYIIVTLAILKHQIVVASHCKCKIDWHIHSINRVQQSICAGLYRRDAGGVALAKELLSQFGACQLVD